METHLGSKIPKLNTQGQSRREFRMTRREREQVVPFPPAGTQDGNNLS